MPKRITGVFATRDAGQQAAQALLEQHINPERLSLLAGAPVAAEKDTEHVGAGATTGALVGAGLTGLTTFVVPGIGILLGAASAIATLGIAAATSDTVTQEPYDQSKDLEQVLIRIGFMPEQARGYADDVRLGRTLVAVDAEEAQTDLIADTLHRYGGYKLEFRPT